MISFFVVSIQLHLLINFGVSNLACFLVISIGYGPTLNNKKNIVLIQGKVNSCAYKKRIIC